MEAQVEVGLDHLEADLYTLRHGGISWDVATQPRTILEAKRLARWKTELLLPRYEKHVRVQTQLAKLSHQQQELADKVSQLLPQLYQSPLLVNALIPPRTRGCVT